MHQIMTLWLKTTAGLLDLHGSVGLLDWDMDKELKLATTTDQFYHDEKLSDQYVTQRPARISTGEDEIYDKASDTFVKPSLWLMVNPNIVCPLQYKQNVELRPEPVQEVQTPQLEPAEMHPLTACPHMLPSQENLLHCVPSSAGYNPGKNPDVSSRPVRNRRRSRMIKAMDYKTLEPGCWPRPPVNYFILIALALKSSQTGSLKVQQIYNFTREHFPFFQTAPDGWKNTIRHNLCFNSSFRKTCNQLCRDGKRKSCFWHLTLDGHRRLQDELHMLTGETLKLLERSMSSPDLLEQ
ncbi:forkhead box protein R1 isoform X2 [Austrofundulus limnaeus]|uniref:Forkhead box protein R1 isoform X2 n=1 Tax=Austrofundulus limnaeus TaxID=52670 RepID=A0A2I4CA33_AUSLI|nr:PREDICTED: forkhead box protein N5-like isoform X2 [Austrofundulus limnaeus]